MIRGSIRNVHAERASPHFGARNLIHFDDATIRRERIGIFQMDDAARL
jgi:hypothetical protein